MHESYSLLKLLHYISLCSLCLCGEKSYITLHFFACQAVIVLKAGVISELLDEPYKKEGYSWLKNLLLLS